MQQQNLFEIRKVKGIALPCQAIFEDESTGQEAAHFLSECLRLSQAKLPLTNNSEQLPAPKCDLASLFGAKEGAWCALDLLDQSYDVKFAVWGSKIAVFVSPEGTAMKVQSPGSSSLYTTASSRAIDGSKLLLRNLGYSRIAATTKPHRPDLDDKSSMALLLEVLGLVDAINILRLEFCDRKLAATLAPFSASSTDGADDEEEVARRRSATAGTMDLEDDDEVNKPEGKLVNFDGGAVSKKYRTKEGKICQRQQTSTKATILAEDLFKEHKGWLPNGCSCVVCGDSLEALKWQDLDTIHLFRASKLNKVEQSLLSMVTDCPAAVDVACIGALSHQLKDHSSFLVDGCKRCNSGLDCRGDTFYRNELHRWRKAPDDDPRWSTDPAPALVMQLQRIEPQRDATDARLSFLLNSKTRQRVWRAHNVTSLCCAAGRHIAAEGCSRIVVDRSTAIFSAPEVDDSPDSDGGSQTADPTTGQDAADAPQGSLPGSRAAGSRAGNQPVHKKARLGRGGVQMGIQLGPDPSWSSGQIALWLTGQILQQRAVAELEEAFGSGEGRCGMDTV